MGGKPKRKPRIAILTGGGDVPGLNPCIKTLVCRADSEGIEVIGIRRGWAGLLEYNPDAPEDPNVSFRYFQQLTPSQVRTIDRTGGTYLHTSRTNPSAAKNKDVPDFLKARFKDGEDVGDFTSNVLKNLEVLKIDAVIPIGGMTLSVLPKDCIGKDSLSLPSQRPWITTSLEQIIASAFQRP